jgi:HNH endonuclease/NUMOD4 motif
MEIWKPVPDFDGYYEVSNNGRVRSVDRVVSRQYPGGKTCQVKRKGSLRKLEYRDGYASVRLQADKRIFKPYVHRIVCEAFNGPCPEGKSIVAHNDGDSTNNRPENLRWATEAENQRDREVHGTHNRGERSHLAKLTWNDAEEIRRSALSSKHIASEFGVTAANIRQIRRLETWVPV